jgi:hypothetical protein
VEIEYQYAFTGKYGSTLYEALRERDFDNYIGKEKDYLLGEAKFGGEQREGFVSWLEDRLSYARWANRSEKAGVRCEGLSEYLMAHELPDDECELREKYADIRADDIMELEEGKADDIDTAYTFGFLKSQDIPDEEIEKLILVNGFYCDIHGGNTSFEKPIPISEVLKCPSCGHPVCRECANCHTDNPKNIEDAREYIASCESVSGHAYCGNCGDYSVEFMLRFLKAVNCPIPPECEEFKPIPRSARFCMTATVGALPNKDSILQTAIAEFNKGTAGIIEIQDPSGKIWAIPERHEDGWKVGIMRPEER